MQTRTEERSVRPPAAATPAAEPPRRVVPRAAAPRPVPPEAELDHPSLYFNRELGWLDFNWRVLHQARDERVPLLERVRFVAITCGNLDEFFQKRVGGLKRQEAAGVSTPSYDGRPPADQLRLIRGATHIMQREMTEIWERELRPGLAEHAGVVVSDYADLDATQQALLDYHFRDQIYPILTPLDDTGLIKELYRASRAGVRIDLIVRGHSRLRPGLPGFSENIRITSIVGRFLEHDRIFYFHNGSDPEIFIGSADWRQRNLADRVEALVPIRQPELRSRLIEILDLALRDNVLAWDLRPDGTYVQRRPEPGEAEINSHEILMHDALRRASRRGEVWQLRSESAES